MLVVKGDFVPYPKKGTFLTLVYSEVNLTVVHRNTWLVDYGITTHISVSM